MTNELLNQQTDRGEKKKIAKRRTQRAKSNEMLASTSAKPRVSSFNGVLSRSDVV
jgi:hypothetical protein